MPVTKVLLTADYVTSREKLHRVTDLVDDLVYSRNVLVEEVDRLDRRKRFYTITNHLYNHDARFVENEQHLQEAHRLIRKIDNYRDKQRRRAHALAFVVGAMLVFLATRMRRVKQHLANFGDVS